MSKLLSNIALGASAGIAAGGLAYYFEQRSKTDKPLIPSGVRLLIASLDPAIKGGLIMARTAIDRVLAAGADEEADHDGGDSLTDEENEQTLDGPIAPFGDNQQQDQGHPAGPGFAPTPA